MAEPKMLRMTVRVTVETAGGYTGDRLSIEDSLELPARRFLEVCQILARFEELTENIRQTEKARQ